MTPLFDFLSTTAGGLVLIAGTLGLAPLLSALPGGYPRRATRVFGPTFSPLWLQGELLRRSVDDILDDGFFYREHRMRHVALAAESGAGTAIHFIDTPLDVVQRRLERRNADLPRYNFHIDPTILASFLEMFERPAADEGARLITIDSAAQEPSEPRAR